MAGRTLGDEDSGSRGFSLFSAINGLFERARSSAEKESQRLFTSPMPQSGLARERRPNRRPESGDIPTRASASGSPRSALPDDTLAMTRRRPRPARSHSSKTGTAPRKRLAPTTRSPSLHASSPEEPLAKTPSLPAAAAIDEVDAEAHGALEAPTPTPSAVSKRKRSVRRSPSPVSERYADSPKRVRAGAADNGPTFLLDAGDHSYEELDYKALRHSGESSRESVAHASAFALPPVALQRTSTVSTAVSDSAHRPRNDASTLDLRTSEHIAARRAEAMELRPTAITSPQREVEPAEKPEVPSMVEPVPVVERGRLEKVERELHRLKKIIASLLPDELNDDDLRSVYGDLDQHQPQRLSSDDIIMQLMKTRLGAAARYNTLPSSLDLPPSPTSNSPTSYGLSAQSMPPPPAPPPPPMHPTTAALVAGRQSHFSYPAMGRPRSVASLLRRDSVASDTASSMLGDYPPVHSATVRRLRADLRPVSGNPQMVQKKQAPPPPPPPHKDPGVMSQLLEEMKHHKLRSVRKPKDMTLH
ncbi:hypothetical protein GGI20_004572 [Coemansia sp. BCRC 34301]|nr:hypothetical protein GGI20_004572 [Coemansia sp. BCRC 34301]